MPPRRSKRRAKPTTPTTPAAALAETAKAPADEDKENATCDAANVAAPAKAAEVPAAAELAWLDDVDQITPVYSKPKPAKTAKTRDKEFPLFDDDDEIAPLQKAPTSQAKAAETENYDIDDVDEITPVHKTAPVIGVLPAGENADSLAPDPNRPPLGALQPKDPAPFRPKKVTYGKRRQVHPVEMPTSQALGVIRCVSPEKSGTDGAGKPERQEMDFEDGKDEDDEVQTPEERSKGLQQFWKEQRALWAEVDAVDLEEELD